MSFALCALCRVPRAFVLCLLSFVLPLMAAQAATATLSDTLEVGVCKSVQIVKSDSSSTSRKVSEIVVEPEDLLERYSVEEIKALKNVSISSSGKSVDLVAKATGTVKIEFYYTKSFRKTLFCTMTLTISKSRTPIAKPTVATGLVYGYTNQVGVASGEGYSLTGTCVTNAAGSYVAYATPDDDHCWTDNTRDRVELHWSIAPRRATVTVLDSTKVKGVPGEPYFHTKNENFITQDPTPLSWAAWRTNASEEVGTYDVFVCGKARQGGYDITYVGGKMIIAELPKTFDIVIENRDGIVDVRTNGVSVLGTLTLPADATSVALELVATNTIPVCKFSKDGGVTWFVTNMTPVITVAANDTLVFMSKEAETTGVTEGEAWNAIKEAMPETSGKVDEIVGGGKVGAKVLAAWIAERMDSVSSADIAASDYVAASVNLGTDKVITEENAKVSFVSVGSSLLSGSFNFRFGLEIDETPQALKLAKEYVAGCIWATGDLGEGFGNTVDPGRVEIAPDGSVKITPLPGVMSEFFRIVLPRDR